MPSDPQELGKGLFGYRKSAVNQILADRDVMLRQAEGRVRAAESKVAELETELGSMRDRNSRMDEQLDRLRTQLDALAGRVDANAVSAAPPVAAPPVAAPPENAAPESHAWPPEPETDTPPSVPTWEEADVSPAEPSHAQPVEHRLEYGESEAAFAGLDGLLSDQAEPEPMTPEVSYPAEPHADVSIFDEGEVHHAFSEATDGRYQAGTEGSSLDSAWRTAEPDHPQPDAGVGDMVYGPSDYSYEPFVSGSEPSGEASPFAFAEDTGHFEEEADEGGLMTFEHYEGTPASAEAWDAAPQEPAFQAEPIAQQMPEPAPGETARVTESFAERPAEPTPTAPAEPAAPSVSSEAMDVTNRFLTDEIQGILSAAEDSAARIVERARATTQHQIAQSNRLWREVQAEVSRFASWREQIDPVIRSVQSKVENVRSEIDGVPERIRQALAPMADSISSIDSDLAELASACSPPLLLTPSGLDSEGDQFGQWGQDAGPDADASDQASDEHEGGHSPGHLAG